MVIFYVIDQVLYSLLKCFQNVSIFGSPITFLVKINKAKSIPK